MSGAVGLISKFSSPLVRIRQSSLPVSFPLHFTDSPPEFDIQQPYRLLPGFSAVFNELARHFSSARRVHIPGGPFFFFGALFPRCFNLDSWSEPLSSLFKNGVGYPAYSSMYSNRSSSASSHVAKTGPNSRFTSLIVATFLG